MECFLLRVQNRILPVNLKFGSVKLIKRVKTAHSFLQCLSNQFHVIILSLIM